MHLVQASYIIVNVFFFFDFILNIDECRINYCWTKLCLFLDVRRVKTIIIEVIPRVPGNLIPSFRSPKQSSALKSYISVRVFVHLKIYSPKGKDLLEKSCPK